MNYEETRIDPQDGKAKTLGQLMTNFPQEGASQQDVLEYWDSACKPLAHFKANHSTRHDPFMTGGLSRPAPSDDAPSAPNDVGKGLYRLQTNPFLVGIRGERSHDIAYDRKVRNMYFSEMAYAVFGAGDASRTFTARIELTAIPAMVFGLVFLIWTVLQHYSPQACIAMSLISTLAPAYLMLLWYLHTDRGGSGSFSLPMMGLLCLIAALAGILSGRAGYQRHWEQIWWTSTGQNFNMTSATVPAMARADAATVDFRDSSGTFQDTLVDQQRSAGFKDGHFFCVAPILSPSAADGALLRVNFWAVGIDCCQEIGSYTCDAARTSDGGYGVVMRNNGYPCPSCNVPQFKKAVAKAEMNHGLVSAPGALFVRWVSDKEAVKSSQILHGVLEMLLCMCFASLASFTAGTTVWYFGLGRQMLTQGDTLRPKSY